MKKLVFGVGTNDVGDSWINDKATKWYGCWVGILSRCYNEGYQINYPTYRGCSVCEEWFIASNFKKFYDANYIESYMLDKDILIDGNKIYSPDTCRFVPQQINMLFVCRGNKSGYPTGVHFNEKTNKFMASCSLNGKTKTLGSFSSPKQAHESYLVQRKNTVSK